MEKADIESVGFGFQEDLLTEARNRTLEIIRRASEQIKAGVTEAQARQIVKKLSLEYQCEKFWHAPQIRFGVNTLRAFGEPGLCDVVLGENDLYFLDLGPVYEGHEGDVGRTYTVGHDLEMLKAAQDVETLWNRVRNRWLETKESGEQLYAYARQEAEALGWELSLHEASGHRIADFPHAARQRSSIEGIDFRPSSSKWILEIQIKHPTRPFGAFFEDLLADSDFDELYSDRNHEQR